MTVSIRSGIDDGALQVNGVDAVAFSLNGITCDIPSKLESISASISSNAITVSASNLILDFRSETVSSGTITTVSGTPANLVIAATDSFGLTTATGVGQRIVILAINNAGTIELAATAMYGGVPLGEGYAITTSATATTATSVKSTTARTAKSFRVIGFIDATFTTAVGWSSLTVIQGAGGLNTASFTSLGVGQTWQDLAASRLSGVTYYNNNARAIAVHVCSGVSGATGTTVTASVNGVTVGYNTLSVTSSAAGVTFIVPPGQSYAATYTYETGSYWAELK
jgi:hypothetical protein